MKNRFIPYFRALVLFFIIAVGIEFMVESGNKPAFIAFPYIGIILLFVLVLLLSAEMIVMALENVMLQGLSEEARTKYFAEKSKKPALLWINKVYKKLTDARAIENESEITLDHNYDGILELDNNLPPWWKWGFYISIVFAFVYLGYYQVFNGDNQYQELDKKIALAKIEIEEYKKTAKDLIDYNSVVLLTEASDINAGKGVFEKNCVACHMTDGGGGIGPNLTDKNWILGGGINNVFKTISLGGRDGKGMEPWSKKGLKPSEIAQVASYILTNLASTTPANPKEAEGDIWEEKTTEAVVATAE